MSDEDRLSAFHQGQILCEGLKLVRQDICEWINTIFEETVIDQNQFLDDLYSGIILCELLHHLQDRIGDDKLPKWWYKPVPKPNRRKSPIRIFDARDNVSKFLDWCKKSGFNNTILFETNGLIQKNEEKNVLLTLLKLTETLSNLDHIPLPEFAKYYRQLTQEDAEVSNIGKGMSSSVYVESTVGDIDDSTVSTDSGFNSPRGAGLGASPASGRHSEKRRESISNKVEAGVMENAIREVNKKCCCDMKFEIEKLTMHEGKYKFGNQIRFVRVFKGTVVIRVGGGWETLNEYVQKVDPCQKTRINSGSNNKSRRSSLSIQTDIEQNIKQPNNNFEQKSFIKKVKKTTEKH